MGTNIRELRDVFISPTRHIVAVYTNKKEIITKSQLDLLYIQLDNYIYKLKENYLNIDTMFEPFYATNLKTATLSDIIYYQTLQQQIKYIYNKYKLEIEGDIK